MRGGERPSSGRRRGSVVVAVRWRVRLRSWFDATMDRGTPALVGWLAVVSLLMILVITVLVVLLAPDDSDTDGGWLSIAWMSLLRTLDPGTMGGDKGGAVFLALMLAVTIGGIFIVSSLIGVLTTGLENRIAELRKGRSPVITRGHTVLLGWSDQVFTVVAELVRANQANRRTDVVVLADRDKVGMLDEIRARVGDTGRLRVTCRSGSPLKRADLDLVSLDTARSIIVVAPAGPDADIDVIKVLLLLNNRPWPARRPHVVAAVQESANLAAARLAAGEHAQLVDADDITVRLVVQSHRQSGLSTVYSDLLTFDGNEIYLHAEPELAGRTYGEAVQAYAAGCPIGLRDGDGRISLNPPADTPIAAADQIIMVAEDESLIRLASRPHPLMAEYIVEVAEREPVADRTLLVGWNDRGGKVLHLLDQLVAPGSAVDVAAAIEPVGAADADLANLTLRHIDCEPTHRRALQRLDLGSYQHVIVLADDRVPPDQADDRTLVTLLHLRDIETALGDPYSIVTEMYDDANREVAQVTKADDFIVSTHLISLVLTQLAENRHLQPILADLFDPAGAAIALQPAQDYVRLDVPVSFATVVESALRRGQTAIGFRHHHLRDTTPQYGVVLNPPRSEPVTFAAGDAVIVITDGHQTVAPSRVAASHGASLAADR